MSKLGEGIEKCMEVEKNTKSIGRLFFCCTRDCGHFKWENKVESSGESPCGSKCTYNDKQPCQNLSCMFTTFAQITEQKDVEISINITMRKGKGVTEDNRHAKELFRDLHTSM